MKNINVRINFLFLIIGLFLDTAFAEEKNNGKGGIAKEKISEKDLAILKEAIEKKIKLLNRDERLMLDFLSIFFMIYSDNFIGNLLKHKIDKDKNYKLDEKLIIGKQEKINEQLNLFSTDFSMLKHDDYLIGYYFKDVLVGYKFCNKVMPLFIDFLESILALKFNQKLKNPGVKSFQDLVNYMNLLQDDFSAIVKK